MLDKRSRKRQHGDRKKKGIPVFYVYELQDESGVPFYVGKGKGRRIKQHEQKAKRGIHSHVCCKIRSMMKRGEEIKKVIVFESNDEGAAFAEEIRLIAHYGRENLTNQTDGGDGQSNPSQEVRGKMSAARMGIKASDETRLRLRLSHLGLRHTKETKERIAAKQRTIKKPWAVDSVKNLGDGFKGHKWSDEHRRKFNKARKGHSVTEETRAKISASKMGSTPWNKGIKGKKKPNEQA